MEIRMGNARDAEAVRQIYKPIVEQTAISFELVVPTTEQIAERITQRQPLHPWLVVTEADQVLGYAYAGPFSGRAAYDWSVEASVYLDESVRGKRVGVGLYTALFGILVAQGYRRIMAGITLPNVASVALHEKMGLSQVGVYRSVGWKFDQWHDVGWWQGALRGEGDPTRIRPFTEFDQHHYDALIQAGRAMF